MELSISVIAAYGVGIILLYILGRSLLIPMKWLLKLVFNALLGGVTIVIINFIGNLFSFHIPLNIISALIVGFLGVPGVILLVILKFLFGY